MLPYRHYDNTIVSLQVQELRRIIIKTKTHRNVCLLKSQVPFSTRDSAVMHSKSQIAK